MWRMLSRARARRRRQTDRLDGWAALRLVGDVADSILRIADRGDDGARAVGATDDDDDVGFALSAAAPAHLYIPPGPL
jgi:hypothetical protein